VKRLWGRALEAKHDGTVIDSHALRVAIRDLDVKFGPHVFDLSVRHAHDDAMSTWWSLDAERKRTFEEIDSAQGSFVGRRPTRATFIHRVDSGRGRRCWNGCDLSFWRELPRTERSHENRRRRCDEEPAIRSRLCRWR